MKVALLLALVFLVPLRVSAQEEAAPAPVSIERIPGVPSLREPPKSRATAMPPGTLPPGAPLPGFGLPPGVSPTTMGAQRIRPEFQPGNTYRFLVTTEVQPQFSSGFVMEQQARYDAKVRTDGKSGVVLKGRTERLDLTLGPPGSGLTYRSLEPGDKDTPLGRHLRTMLHRPVEIVLDESGRVDGAEVGGTGDESGRIEGMPIFGPEELTQWVAGLSQGLPEKAVAPGESWSFRGSRTVGSAGSADFEIAYRNEGSVNHEGQQCIALVFSGTLAGSLPDGDSATTRFESGTLEGRLYFDPLDKMVRLSEQTVELWLGEPPAEGEAEARLPVRETTTLRLLHVIPTP